MLTTPKVNYKQQLHDKKERRKLYASSPGNHTLMNSGMAAARDTIFNRARSKIAKKKSESLAGDHNLRQHPFAKTLMPL